MIFNVSLTLLSMLSVSDFCYILPCHGVTDHEISGRGSLYYKENAVNNACFCAIRTALNTAFSRVTRGFYGVSYQDGVFDGANTVLNTVKNGVLYVYAIYL